MFNSKDVLLQRAVTLIRHVSICLLLVGRLSTAFGQTTYYVASSGNDNNNGRSSGSPFQTIAKVNTLSLQPGDQVLFRRNDTFRGSLQIRQSGSSNQPIVIDAYESGNKPVLAGSVPVTNWNNIGNNVWQANCPSCGDRVNGVYRDNTALPLGRYPNLDASNRGYLTVQSHSGRTQLNSQQSLSTNWTGGEAVFRPVQWILNRAAITGQNGNTLYLDGSGTYDISDGWGYFIQSHPSTLDQRGEWYYNPGNKTIQLYDNQSNPNNQTITAAAYEGINLSNVSFITVRNVTITQVQTAGLLVSNSSNIVFANNDVTQSGQDGLLLQGNGQQVLMENNLIEDINSNGVDISPYQNITFRNNIIRRIGLIPGRGRSGDGTYVGFQSASTANTVIENNVLDNIGYNALNFSTNSLIQRNQISNFCLTKSDGSGLYIWNGNHQPMSNIRLVSNVVYNGIGAPEGTPGGAYSGANGIYLDDCTTGIELTNNSVFDCRGLGMFLHGSDNIVFTGNTSYNNGEGQLAITSAGGCQPRNNTGRDNIFVSKQAFQFNVKFESSQNDLVNFGQFDNNVYARPYEDTYKIRAVYNSTTGADLSLAEWQSRYGKDYSTRNSPITYSSGSPDSNIKGFLNPTGNASQFSLDGTYRDTRNNVYSGQVTVPAFSSVVLLKENGQAPPPTSNLRDPENPANAVAGLDYGYYEGSWNSLPDFNALSPVKTGTASIADISPRNRDDDFALRFTGYINVPTDGVYTFYTNSDDGSKLFIGSTEVVNNDGGHPEQERSGAIGLKAGKHAITITYYEGGGGQALSASYSGPSVGKQTIPAGAFYRVSTGGGTTPPPTTPPTSNLRDPENPANAVAGLDYGYYEGSWNSLPDFSALSPVKTGTASIADISPRNRDDNFGLRFTGYVNVPTDGVYTFYTNSDDGSKLYIGSTEVVNNDGGHPEQERSGAIGLKAGKHAITITYYEGGGGQALSASYSGPNVGKQTIPAGAFYRVSTGGGTTPPPTTPPTSNLRDPENPANAVAGLDYGYYEGSWNSLPDFSALSPVKTGTASIADISPRNRDDNFGLRFTGYVNVPTDGVYTFYTNSDDGSKLYIGSTEVVNNDGGHAEQERSGAIGLKAGKHAITITYYEGGGGQALSASYSGPNVGKQTIPAGAFYRVSTGGGTTPPPTTPPTSNLRDPENPANAVAGLDYGYYEGSWNSLPDFSALSPVKTGTASIADLSPRNREENFGLRFTGYVNVPTDGVYTFYTISDDGSKLYIGSTEVLNNDGAHGDQERSGTIGLKAGKHAITVVYFQGGGGKSLSVSYSGPNVGKQTIPAGAFYRVSTGGGTTPPPTTTPPATSGSGTGLRGEYFNNKMLNAPSLMTRTDATVNFEWGNDSPAPGLSVDDFSIRWTGKVEAPVTGTYIFSTNTDDGVRLWVNGTMLINDWNTHAPTVNNGTPINLTAGQLYDIRMEYYENVGGASAKLSWSYPGQSEQIIPKGRLYPATSGGRLAANSGNESGVSLLMRVYPIPAQEVVWIRYYAKTAGEATVQLINTAAQPVLRSLHQVTPGENLIKMMVGQLSRGSYILSLTHDNQRLTSKVLLTE